MTDAAQEALDPVYIAARTVLLDALDALAEQRQALVIVGAQAVFLRTGLAGLRTAPFTADGDVALHPQLLSPEPLLEEAMQRAGFILKQRAAGIEPGTWLRSTVVDGQEHVIPIDLIVPQSSIRAGNTRGARLPIHGKRAAKLAYGLEAALVDQAPMVLMGLAIGDEREIEVAVAGVGALVVAKVHKLLERVAAVGREHRLRNKDAGDVLRLFRATEVREMAERLASLRGDPMAGPVTDRAIAGLDELFGAPAAPGVRMSVAAVELELPADQVEGYLTTYVRELVGLLGRP